MRQRKGHRWGPLRTCATCGASFKAWSKESRFCSFGCGRASLRRPKLEATCLKCGKVFLVRGKVAQQTARYCSHACVAAATHKPAIHNTVICARCGKRATFTTSSSARKYCSAICFHLARRKPSLQFHCQYCGEIFVMKKRDARNGRRKYCSSRCAGLASPMHWKGKNNEHKTGRLLRREGYRVTRSVGSWGLWDIVAIPQTETLFSAKPYTRLIQVKSNAISSTELTILRNAWVPPHHQKEVWIWKDRQPREPLITIAH